MGLEEGVNGVGESVGAGGVGPRVWLCVVLLLVVSEGGKGGLFTLHMGNWDWD